MKITRRDAMKGAGSAILAAAIDRALARNPRGGARPNGINYQMGANLAGIAYYSTEFPFLDMFKQAGASGSTTALNASGVPAGLWATSTSGTYDTGEECYLSLDANNWPISLTGTGLGSHTQVYDRVQTFVVNGLPVGATAAPGTAYVYPAGTYRVMGHGTGVLVFTGDIATNSGSITCVSNCTNSGATITTSATGASTWEFTVNIPTPTSSGFGMYITSTGSPANSGSNYIKVDGGVVNTLFATLYDAGSIFNPNWLNALKNFSYLRMMDWNNTNGNNGGMLQFTTSGTWSGGAGNLSAVWKLPSGTYNMVDFAVGGSIAVTCTAGSAAVTYTPTGTGIASGINLSWNYRNAWSTRAPLTAASWGGPMGVPYEVQMALCNQTGCKAWLNIPVTADGGSVTTNSYSTSLATLANSTLTVKYLIEFGNEIWDGSAGYLYARYAALTLFGATNYAANFYACQANWYGAKVGGVAQAFYTALGATAYANNCTISMGGQGGDTSQAWLGSALSGSPYWIAYGGGQTAPIAQTPAKITAVHGGWYLWGGTPAGQLITDINTMSAESDGGVADFIAEQYSYTGKYTSTPGVTGANPTGGYIGYQAGKAAAMVNWVATNYGSYSLKVYGYEVGDGWGVGNNIANVWPARNSASNYLTTSGTWSGGAGSIAGTWGNPTGTYSMVGFDANEVISASFTNGSAAATYTPSGTTIPSGTPIVSPQWNLLQRLHNHSSSWAGVMQSYFRALRSAGIVSSNVFQELDAVSNYNGTYSPLESTMQLTDSSNNPVPLSSLPATWQGLQAYIASG